MPIATSYSNEMAMLTGNAGGALQQLPPVSLVTGRERGFVATIPLVAQAVGTGIGIARLPAGAVLCGITMITDTALGSSTLSVGDTNNPTLYSNAATMATADTPVRVGRAATTGVQINTNLYDATTGALNRSFEDLVLFVGAAALPASGTLKIIVLYMID